MTAQPHGASAAPVLPFGLYAEVYDLLYADKDYAAEAAFVAGLLQQFLGRPAAQTRVVDLACGTGRHVMELAALGHRMTGSDISSQMVSLAKAAAAKRGLPIPFHVQSFQTCGSIGGEYDAALAMFASLGYLSAPEDLGRTLAGVRALLAPGGVFVFDVWNGQAVLQDYSPVREKRASGASVSVIRTSRTTLDRATQSATVNFEFTVTRRGGAPAEFSESHRVRYYFPDELAQDLEKSGFEVALRCPFLEPSRALAPRDWNMTFVARKQ